MPFSVQLREQGQVASVLFDVRWFLNALSRDSRNAEDEHKDKELSRMVAEFEQRFMRGRGRTDSGLGRRASVLKRL